MRRKIFSIGLALMMVFSMAGFSFAEEDSNPGSSDSVSCSEISEAGETGMNDSAAAGNDGTGAAGSAAPADVSSTPGANGLDMETIHDNKVPLASLDSAEAPGRWALLNLLAALLTALISVLLMVLIPFNIHDSGDEILLLDRIPLKFFSAIVGILAPFLFFLTENVGGNCVMTDSITPVMIAILAAQTAVMIVARYKNKEMEQT